MDNTILCREAVCPYFKKDAPASISCEGLAPGSHIVHYFASKELKTAWGKCACSSYDYAKRCLVAAMHEEINE